jgi:protoporphyrinogen oxidase
VRQPASLAQYPVGHRARVDAAVAAARPHRIVLAGADYRGPGVNDLCADAAVVTAEVAAWT